VQPASVLAHGESRALDTGACAIESIANHVPAQQAVATLGSHRTSMHYPAWCPILVKSGHQDNIKLQASRRYSAQKEQRLGIGLPIRSQRHVLAYPFTDGGTSSTRHA
jgi:hypothetical protein